MSWTLLDFGKSTSPRLPFRDAGSVRSRSSIRLWASASFRASCSPTFCAGGRADFRPSRSRISRRRTRSLAFPKMLRLLPSCALATACSSTTIRTSRCAGAPRLNAAPPTKSGGGAGRFRAGGGGTTLPSSAFCARGGAVFRPSRSRMPRTCLASWSWFALPSPCADVAGAAAVSRWKWKRSSSGGGRPGRSGRGCSQ